MRVAVRIRSLDLIVEPKRDFDTEGKQDTVVTEAVTKY